ATEKRKVFILRQRRLRLFLLGLKVTQLGEQAPFEKTDLIEVFLFVSFIRKYRCQLTEPFILPAECRLIRPGLGVKLMHLRFKSQFMDWQAGRMLHDGHFISADPRLIDEAPRLHHSRDGPPALVPSRMVGW